MCTVQQHVPWGNLQRGGRRQGGMSWQPLGHLVTPMLPPAFTCHAPAHTQVTSDAGLGVTAGAVVAGNLLSHPPVAHVLSDDTPVAARQLHSSSTKVRPTPAFLQLLRSVGAKGETFTQKELCVLLKDYIVAKQLYDEKDPRVVYCANDALGQVFGLVNFTIGDVMTLLQANCTTLESTAGISSGSKVNVTQSVEAPMTMCDSQKYVHSTNNETPRINNAQQSQSCPSPQKLKTCPLPSSQARDDIKYNEAVTIATCSSATGMNNQSYAMMDTVRKRPADSILDSDSARDCKIRRKHGCRSLQLACDEQGGNIFPWYRRQEGHDTDDSEVLSIQSKETVYVKDSSDDLWFVEDEEEEEEEDKASVFSLEYEVESDVSDTCNDEEEQDLSHSDDDTDEEVVVQKTQDNEMNFWADSSDISSDESDTEIPKQDNWHCKECGTVNRPVERHCGRCWKLRPGWLTAAKHHATRSKKSSTAYSGAAYDHSDDSDYEGTPWVPVEKALHKLRSTCQVPDTKSANHMSSVSSSTTSQHQQQQVVASPCVARENITQTLPLILPVSNHGDRYSSSQGGSTTSAPLCKNSTVSAAASEASPKKCYPPALSTPLSTMATSSLSCNVQRSSTLTSEKRATVTSLQRSSTPMSGSEATASSPHYTSSCAFVSASDISYINQSMDESPVSSQGERYCTKSDAVLPLLQQCDSGVSSLESNLSEGPSSFSRLCSAEKRDSFTVATKSQSAPTTPVKNSINGSSDVSLLTPTKRVSMLEKFKGLPHLTATRRTLSHYQIATPLLSSSSPTLRHCSSAPVIAASEMTGGDVKSTALPCIAIAPANKSSSSALERVNKNETIAAKFHAIDVLRSSGVSTGTQTCHAQQTQSNPVSTVTSHRDDADSSKSGPSAAEQSGDTWCVICLTKPKEASIIHGRTGHQVCCYSCAKRLRRRGKPCPVCRRPIHRVIKNYVM